MARNLTSKQKMALELLTCGKGLTYKEIAEQVNVNPKTLWEWRNSPDYVTFQQALQKLEDERWLTIVDVAKKSAYKLCEDGNQKMVEFVLKNEGYNPTQKVEADLKTDIVINIGEDDAKDA